MHVSKDHYNLGMHRAPCSKPVEWVPYGEEWKYGFLQDELNAEIREKKKERNQNSKAFSENRRLSQTVREMIRAKKVEDARRACEEQVSREKNNQISGNARMKCRGAREFGLMSSIFSQSLHAPRNAMASGVYTGWNALLTESWSCVAD